MRREAGYAGLGLLFALLGSSLEPAAAQGLPEYHPNNPVVESRSGIYFQPFVEPHAGWRVSAALDYASMTELAFGFSTDTSFLLDAESYRFSVGVAKDLGPYDFLLADVSIGGAYAGGLDGFLNWYHDLLGVSFPEREGRPENEFAYHYTYPDGTRIDYAASNFHLNDIRIGAGHRFSRKVQSVLSVTLPTSTAADGYGRGVVSASLLTTVRAPITSRLTYEGELGLGYTPTHGPLKQIQDQSFIALTSGLRYRFWGKSSLYANFYWTSPQYDDAEATALEREELDLDFGWIYRTSGGRDWRIGLTEDLYPSGPGIDLIMRVGTSW
jgi:uncharacterized protein DUF3187